jgi:hypothetical protein
MEMLGAITGLIGAGLQAQAQHDQLMFQYAHFNWEKERAATQDRFASASRSDQYGNVTGYDPILNKWSVTLAPTQKEISDAKQKEELLQLTKDAPAARKIKEQIQARSKEAVEPYLRAAAGYQYDQPPPEAALRSDLTALTAISDQARAKANQGQVMRQAARLGRGADAQSIIQATDQSLGNADTMNARMLSARQDAMKEFAARTALHEEQWGKPMATWASLMSQGGDIPGIPKSALTDTTGQQQQAMLNAFNQGTSRVGSAFDQLANAAGKSPDLSGVAKALASIKMGKGGSGSGKMDDGSGGTWITDGSGDYQVPSNTFSFSGFGSAPFDSGRNEWGTSGGGDTF